MTNNQYPENTGAIPGQTTLWPETAILGETGDGLVDESAMTLALCASTLDDWTEPCLCPGCAANEALNGKLDAAAFAHLLRSPFIALVRLGCADELIRQAYAAKATEPAT